ncbi:hypothetical protein V4T71_002937 [Vibrio vulnificus]
MASKPLLTLTVKKILNRLDHIKQGNPIYVKEFGTTEDKLEVILSAVLTIEDNPVITEQQFYNETGLSVKKVDSELFGFNFIKGLVCLEARLPFPEEEGSLPLEDSNVYPIDFFR